MAKCGEVSWDEPASNAKKFNRDDFLKLENGPNSIRFVTNPFKYLYHKVKFEGDTGWGRNVRCCGDDCSLCAEGNKAQNMYVAYVINRRDGKIKKFEFKQGVMNQIQTIKGASDSYKDMSAYDWMIIVNPNGGPTGYYTAVPGVASPLSANEIIEKEKLSTDTLKAYVAQVSKEEMEDSMNRIQNYITNNNRKLAEAAAQGQQPQQGQRQYNSAPPPQQKSARRAAPVVEEEECEVDFDNAVSFKVTSKK